MFVNILRGSKHLAEPTKTHWLTWFVFRLPFLLFVASIRLTRSRYRFGCVIGCTLISYIISSAIPVFGGLGASPSFLLFEIEEEANPLPSSSPPLTVGFIGAFFGTLLSLHAEAIMWM
jgi:hypothetical protein